MARGLTWSQLSTPGWGGLPLKNLMQLLHHFHESLDGGSLDGARRPDGDAPSHRFLRLHIQLADSAATDPSRNRIESRPDALSVPHATLTL
ncbi:MULTISPECIES: hypothetical protein [unclassified Streptomyces]|uniref:hypothetical protein n=1 Tax=unclassified Streptomyces TaxID=2593676 RepID=UPI00365EEDCE